MDDCIELILIVSLSRSLKKMLIVIYKKVLRIATYPWGLIRDFTEGN